MYIPNPEKHMKIKIPKSGNRLAVRLPKRLADDLGLQPGAVVDLNQDGSKIAIERAPNRRLPRHRLEELVAEMDRLGPQNEPKPIDWGPDRGAEIIDDEYAHAGFASAGGGSSLGGSVADARRRAKRRKTRGRAQRS